MRSVLCESALQSEHADVQLGRISHREVSVMQESQKADLSSAEKIFQFRTCLNNIAHYLDSVSKVIAVSPLTYP